MSWAAQMETGSSFSPNGKCEVVYKANGEIETDPLNMGTYNFYDPQLNPLLHGLADVIPYMLRVNAPEDWLTPDRFTTLFSWLWDKSTTNLGATIDWLLGVDWEP